MEKATEDVVGDLNLELLEDDVRQSDDNRVDSVQLQSDRVRVQHADARVDHFNAMESELAEHEAHSEVGLLVQEHFVGDVVEVKFNGEIFLSWLLDNPESKVDGSSGNHVRLSEATAEVSKVLNLIFELDLLVLAIGLDHAWEHDVKIVGRHGEVKRVGQLSLIVPALAAVHVKV